MDYYTYRHRHIPIKKRHKGCLRTCDIIYELNHRLPECPDVPETRSIRMPPNPMYRTTYMDYGCRLPKSFEAPHVFYPTRRAFSNDLMQFGMYRDTTLNL
ncbi:hypothetical protein J437_LFUL011998 [Ladona fulva]|uniref:Uncharacterized protein n=1 Tax=Ladona fulva TaxID=123851 RepID=A0A8K0NXW0_LADFU|nr:hypothetical protein J437_LFUL011998 [Ladona fulva]